MSRFLLGLTALCIAVAAIGLLAVRGYLTSPLPGLQNTEILVIDDGASLRTVAAELSDRGLLRWPRALTLWARYTGDANRIRAGEYELQPGSTPLQLLELFVSGRVKLHPFTIVEGWTVRDLGRAIRASDVLRPTLDFFVPERLAEQLDLGYPHAEGLFFPDTYLVPRGTTDRALLAQAAEIMEEHLALAWSARRSDLPLETPYELLTLASIVERETALAAERAQVAGVFVRRLEQSMRLQTDPTVIYGIGAEFDGNLTRVHLTTDTPYNTYTRAGLPPTPIALPGAAALRAAAQPADGNALYFVASGDPDGSHVFSATLEEHNAAVAAYIARLKTRARTAGE